jgi:prevent-host-death family protein
MMKTVNVHEAKTHLSRLLAEVSAGEEVVIAKAGRPLARLVPIRDGETPRVGGRDRGLFTIPDEFDAPLPDDVLREFET